MFVTVRANLMYRKPTQTEQANLLADILDYVVCLQFLVIL